MRDLKNHHGNIHSLLRAMNIERFQKSDDFHILDFNDHIGEIPMITQSRQCDFFQIVITKQHNVEVMIDNIQFDAMAESISFIAPQQMLSSEVKSVEPEGRGYMLLFEPSFLRSTPTDFLIYQHFPFYNLNHSPVYRLHSETTDLFFGYMENMYQHFKDYDTDHREILRSYLNILLHTAKKQFVKGGIEKAYRLRIHEISFLFENLIKNTPNKRKSLAFYAKSLNVSPAYLAECVKKTTGKTGKTILSEYIVLEAKSLLVQSTKTIDDIAHTVGFSATSNFVAFFKKACQLTPNQYRKQHLKF